MTTTDDEEVAMTSVPSGQSSSPQNAMTDEHEEAGSPAQNSPEFGEPSAADGAGQTSAEADRAAAMGEDVDPQYEPERDSAAADDERLGRGAE